MWCNNFKNDDSISGKTTWLKEPLDSGVTPSSLKNLEESLDQEKNGSKNHA